MAPAIPIIMAVSAIIGAGTAIVSAVKGTPKAPQAPSVVDDAKKSQQELQAAYAEQEKLRQRRGQSSTILTGPQGILGATQTRQNTLGA